MPDISRLLEKAEKLIQRGKLDAALEEYQAAWREDPDNDAVGEIVAELHARLGQPRHAVSSYGKLFERATAAQDAARAGLLYRKLLKLGAQDPVQASALALLQEKSRPVEAVELYRTAAQIFLERGDRASALDVLRRVAALDSGNPEAHFRKGEVAESIGQNETAAQAFLRAAELRRAAGANREAMALLERASTLLPTDPVIAMTLARTVFELGNPRRAVDLLEPFAEQGNAESNRLLAEAHLTIGNLPRAEALLWDVAPSLPQAHTLLLEVAEKELRGRDASAGVALLEKLKMAMFAAQKESEYLDFVQDLPRRGVKALSLLEFLARFYDEINADSLQEATCAELFEQACSAEEWTKAADALERLTGIDPYDAANVGRLERLGDNIDARRRQIIASRFRHAAGPAAAPAAPAPAAGPAPAAPAEETGDVLEDLMLQAEIFLQYGLKPRAQERLERIARLFPGEEHRNEKLRQLQATAGFTPDPTAAPPTPRLRGIQGPERAAEPLPDDAIGDFTRVSEITRNIYRQPTAKGVLSCAANEIGRTWRASRCLAALVSPGKPPSAAVEYCAPGMAQSDVKAIVRILTTLVQSTADGNPLSVEDIASSPKVASLAGVAQTLSIRSLLALPMIDADQPIGVIVLEQCDRMRRWRSNEIVVLKTLVDQMVLTLSHVKLRSLMKSLSVADERSGLLNRASYIDCLLSEADRSSKQNATLSVMLMEFGHGQQTVRQYGEEAIQQYVQEAAQNLTSHLRQSDIAVRYDSTTLAIVMPDTKGKDVFFVVDKIRKLLGSVRMGDQDGLPVTTGIAEAVADPRLEPVDVVTELINRAEDALESAHKEGGNTSRLLLPPLQTAASTPATQ